MPRAILETVEAIRSMRIRGAATIGVAAARALADHVQTLEGSPRAILAGARKAARTLDAARPTAVTLHNALGWVLTAVQAESGAGAQKKAARQAADLVATDVAASRAALAERGARQVPDGAVVLTHCHSSTAVAVLEAAHVAGKDLQVIATETRPFRQGLRTVKALHDAGIRCALVVDSAVEHVLATRDIDLVLVGADAVARDGSLVNKIGTAGVARLAQAHEVPFHSAAGLHKFTRRTIDEVPIEERPRSEVVKAGEVPAGVGVFNPVFDRTPPDLVSYITERGLLSPAKAVARNRPKLPPEEVWG